MTYLKRFGPIALIAAGLILVFAMGWNKYLSFDVLSQQSGTLRAWLQASHFL